MSQRVILSWHRDDSKNISLSMLEDTTREYLRLRNPNGLYIAVPHFDKDHYHVHICASGVENKTGKSLRLSKTNLSKLSKGIQEYQIEKYPELKHSLVQRGKGRKNSITEKEYQYKMRVARATDKESLLKVLRSNYQRSVSIKEFFSKLNESKIETYQRSGRVTGIVFNGKIFRFSRLGISSELFQESSVEMKRNNELKGSRDLKKKKHKELNL
ncbi:MAG: relaxase/mobilization nuclease domain-containing protein [Bacteroidetes bacterium]|nr:relaxase/mobilization nuclease domain-containing protein [Bacteroidota bacterium]MBL0065199.1 relaxase/mobilization nuclease domain-containing protein [Bacteroidota bacterium]MBL0138406.1 relaxase/mobilization nuclease domain-containing protein [Bacteroidota bacterium]